MKVYYKKEKDSYSLMVEDIRDLYYLDKLIDIGDVIGKVDYRTTSKGERGEKIKCYLTIKVKSINLDVDSKQVRVLGEIIDAPEDVLKGHHSFVIGIGDRFDIYKINKSPLFSLLLDKLKSKKSFNVLGVVVDNKEATFGEIHHNKINELFTIKNKIKKGEGENEPFYKEVSKKILEMCERYDITILAGPGFAKEEIKKTIKEEKCKIIVGDVSIPGETGLREIIKRGLLSKAIKDREIEEEIKLIERFFEELKKDSKKIVYGVDHIMLASRMGALESIIMVYELLKDNKIKELFEICNKTNTKIIIIEEVNPYYNQLKSFGGVIGFLRYEIL